MPTADRDFQRFAEQGDLTAFTRVYEATAAKLLAMAVRLVRDPGEAEELVQATFVAAIDSAPTYDASRPVEAWLAGILANRARRSHRRTSTEALGEVRDEKPDPAMAVADSELREAIHERIDALAEPYRSVAVLHLRNGLTPSEVAYALGRAPATVRSQLQRAKQMLRAALPAGAAVAALAAPASAGLTAVKTAVTAHAAAYSASLQATLVTTASSALSSWLKTAWITMTGTKIAMTGLGVAALVALSFLWGQEPERPEVSIEAETELARSSRTNRDSLESNDVGERRSAAAPTRIGRGEAPASGRSGLGGLMVTVTHAERGVPSVVIELSKRGDPWTRPHRATTDEDGEARLTEIPAGAWWLQTTSDAVGKWIEIVAQERTELTLEVSEPTWVQGLVVDESSESIAGAEVWTLTQPSHGAAPYICARTDQLGAFRIPIWDLRVVGANSPEHWSAKRLVQPSPGDDKRIQLTLRNGAASLIGRVLDRKSGRPIPNAIVGVLEEPVMRTIEWPDRSSVSLLGVECMTSEDGRFEFRGVVPGMMRVAVEHPSFARSVLDLEVAPRTSEEVEIELGAGATVSGLVTGPDGAPAVGIRVSESGGENRRFRSTKTDDEGRYELSGLAAGSVQLRARASQALQVHEVLELVADGKTEWSPRLREGWNRISGTLCDVRGNPLSGWTIVAQDGRFDAGSPSKVGPDGSFRSGPFLRRGERVLRAHPPEDRPRRGLPKTAAVKSWPGLAVGSSELELVVPDEQMPTAWLRGSLDRDAIDRRIGAVFVRRADGSQRTAILAKDGSFEIGPLAPGLVSLALPGPPERALGSVELSAGQSHDLGLLQPEGLGTVTLNLDIDRPWTELRGKVRIWYTNLESGESSSYSIWQAPLRLRLAVGRYSLQLIDSAFEPLRSEVEVEVDQVSEVTWSPRACPLSIVRFEPPSPFGKHGRLEVRVSERKGGPEVLYRQISMREGVWNCGLNLLPGDYVVTASTEDGLRCEAPLHVEADPHSAPRGWRVRLR